MQQSILPNNETALSEIIEKVVSFRAANPRFGTADMVERCEDIVRLYDQLGQIVLSTDTRRREFEAEFLSQMRLVARLVRDRAWEKLAHCRLLYPRRQ